MGSRDVWLHMECDRVVSSRLRASDNYAECNAGVTRAANANRTQRITTGLVCVAFSSRTQFTLDPLKSTYNKDVAFSKSTPQWKTLRPVRAVLIFTQN